MYRLIGERGYRGCDELGISLLCDEAVTRTIGRSIAVSHWGTVPMAGSNMHGPVICTASPHHVCGYSNGLPLGEQVAERRRGVGEDRCHCFHFFLVGFDHCAYYIVTQDRLGVGTAGRYL
jgi:hypothetical protein